MKDKTEINIPKKIEKRHQDEMNRAVDKLLNFEKDMLKFLKKYEDTVEMYMYVAENYCFGKCEVMWQHKEICKKCPLGRALDVMDIVTTLDNKQENLVKGFIGLGSVE